MYNKFRGRTICRFPHRLEEHPLGRRILQIVNRHLEQAAFGCKTPRSSRPQSSMPLGSRKNQQGKPSPELGARIKVGSKDYKRAYTYMQRRNFPRNCALRKRATSGTTG